MFESVQMGNGRNIAGHIKALLLSFFIHTIMITVAVVLPLIFLQVLPGANLLTYLVAAPPPPQVPNAPAPRAPQKIAEPVVKLIQEGSGFVRPDAIPNSITDVILPPDVGPITVPTGIGVGLLVGSPEVRGPGSGSLLVAAPPVALTPPPAPIRVVTPVGGVVMESKLIRKVMPEYNSLAVRARVEGQVILQVEVDEEGNVSDVRVLKGHPLLDAEAVRAVRQWKYSPTLLNGEPIPVISTVTVIFRLSGRM